MKKLSLIANLMLLSVVALAAGPLPDVDPKAAGDTLVAGMSTGAWILIAAGAGLIVIWLLRLLLLPNLKGKALAWTSSILIGLASFGVAIASSPTKWLEAALAAVSAFMVAAKGWDLLVSTKTGHAILKQPIKDRRK